MNLALGSLYAWSVFVTPLEAEFGWTRTQTSWVFTIAIVTFALSFVVAGRIQDQRGPRICAVTGATLVGLGFILASFTSSLAYLYVAFGFVVGLGNGFGYATPATRKPPRRYRQRYRTRGTPCRSTRAWTQSSPAPRSAAQRSCATVRRTPWRCRSHSSP